MTDKEKAKAYDEAIERANDILKGYNPKEASKATINYIFPELAQSEDERIRKTLIENFKFFGGDYLETSKWGKDDDLLVTDIIAWLEKQGSAWSEEDEKNISTIRIALRDAKLDAPEEFESYGRETTVKDFENAESWLKSIKERIGG